jgi:glycerol-3-phosphate dehydrogenase (NAD(P)+)
MTQTDRRPIRITVLGAGRWGQTLARLWATAPTAGLTRHVTLWDRTAAKLDTLGETPFAKEPDLSVAIAGADVVVLVVTSAGTVDVARQLNSLGVLSPTTIVVNASKGIDAEALRPMSQVVAEALPPGQPQAVLSGPNLAKEVMLGLPTASVIASHVEATAADLQSWLSTDRFRLYSNTDVLGVELGGALKNIFAIVSGYMDGRKLGDNARAALITRGLAEMTRLSVMLGAKVETLYGLSGLGDMLATCSSPLSRNYQVGYRLSQGETLTEVLTSMQEVAEGVTTTLAVQRLTERMQIDSPIIQLVADFISGAPMTEEDLVRKLMTRRLCAETPTRP